MGAHAGRTDGQVSVPVAVHIPGGCHSGSHAVVGAGPIQAEKEGQAGTRMDVHATAVGASVIGPGDPDREIAHPVAIEVPQGGDGFPKPVSGVGAVEGEVALAHGWRA